MAENSKVTIEYGVRELTFSSTNLLQIQMCKFTYNDPKDYYKNGYGFMFSSIEGKQKEGGAKGDRTFDFKSKITMKLTITDILGIGEWLRNVATSQIQLSNSTRTDKKTEQYSSNIYGIIRKVTNSGKSASENNRTTQLNSKITVKKSITSAEYHDYVIEGGFPTYTDRKNYNKPHKIVPVESYFSEISLVFTSTDNNNSKDKKTFPVSFDQTQALGFSKQLIGIAELAQYFQYKIQDDNNKNRQLITTQIEDQTTIDGD